MIEHLRSNWSAYWGILAAIGLIWFRFSRTDRKLSRGDRLCSLLRGNRYNDPESTSYDPGLPGRQLILLLLAFVAIGTALFLVWLTASW